MPSYPTPSDYQEAVQVPETAFEDSALQEAEPRTNVLGLPQPITGGFAAVFPMTTRTGARYAAKCFLQDIPKQQHRYSAIDRHLEAVDLDALLEFDYQPSGIQVNGSRYPLLKMEWAEGTTLNRFVDRHRDDPAVLRALAREWADLLTRLEANDVAHGDLQHGNILVNRTVPSNDPDAVGTLRIRLVDYDTLFVPALSGWESAEVGHRNYQHPDRTEQDTGPAVDRFAGLAIYTALHACAARPDLWTEYDTGENLLFRDADFYDPDASPLFATLSATEETADLTDALRHACYVEPEDVPPLEAVRDGEGTVTTPVTKGRARRRRNDARSDRQSRSAFARAVLPGIGGLVVGCAILAVLGLPIVAALALAGGLTAAGGAATLRYRQLPLNRRRRRLAHERERFTRLIQSLKRQIESLKTQRAEILATVDERRAKRLDEVKDEAIQDILRHHFVGEIRDLEGVTHKHVVRLKAANIRNAYEATPERLADIRQLPEAVRARIRMWRAALIREHEDEIPKTLSPAEQRRLQRYVDHRIEDVDAQMERAREKIEVQKVERERIAERADALPSVTLPRYLRYLLRLDTLPARPGRPAPSAPAPARSAPPAPEPVDADGPWWA